jgi:hypothetical protein
MQVNDIRPDKLLAGMHEAQQRDIEMLPMLMPKTLRFAKLFLQLECEKCCLESDILSRKTLLQLESNLESSGFSGPPE